MNRALKSIIRPLVPARLLQFRADYIRNKFARMPVQDVFAHIYERNTWGGNAREYFSGSGSRDPAIVTPYVTGVREHLQTLGVPLHAVDIGCGDFHVGSQLVDLTESYVGCDIVQAVIEHNRKKYHGKNLTFRVTNAIDDPLPAGNVVLMRQVLQHLSNRQIKAILPKLAPFRTWIITEHIPDLIGFTPNLDHQTGPHIRLSSASGVVLTQPPFNIVPRTRKVICRVPESGGLIETIAYGF